MMRSPRLAGALALLALVLAARWVPAAPAPGAQPGLALVPATAPIVVHVRGVEGIKDRLAALAKEASPDMAGMAQGMVEKFLKEGYKGRKVRGLAKDGPIFAVFTEVPKPGENPPKMAFLVAVTSYDELRDNALSEDEKKNLKKEDGYETTTVEGGEALFFVKKDNFAVVTPSKDVAVAFTKKQDGLDGKLSKELADKLLSSDLGVYVNAATINKQFADQIKQAREQADEGIKSLAEQMQKSQKGQMEMARKLLGGLFQAVEDSQGLLLTLEFRPKGLALHAQSELRGGSSTSTVLKDVKAGAFADLGKLPAGKMFYSGFEVGPELYKALGAIMLGVMADSDSKEAKAAEEALKGLEKAKMTSRLDAVSIPPTGIQVWHCENATEAIDAYVKMIQALGTEGTFQAGQLKEKPTVKAKAQKYGDLEMTHVRLVWDLEKMASGGGVELPEAIKTKMVEGMKKLMGEEMNLWIGGSGKEVVGVIAKDWAAAEKMLDQYTKGKDQVGAEASFTETRKELPDRASAIILVDGLKYAGAIIDFIKPMLEAVMPAPPNLPSGLEKGKASFLGVAISAGPERATFDLVIPSTTIRNIVQIFMPVGGS